MHCVIKHSTPNRIRVALPRNLTEHEAIALEELMRELPAVEKAIAYPCAASFAVEFTANEENRKKVIERLSSITFEELDQWEPQDSLILAPRPRMLYHQLACETIGFFLRLMFLPRPIKTVWGLFNAVPFWRKAFMALKARRIDVSVLDGAAIGIGFTQGANNAGETMFLLHTSELLEDFTQKRAESSLAESLMGIPTSAWKVVDGEEHELPLDEILINDVVVVRTGWAIPVDGVVLRGEAMVNQSSFTGEPLPIMRQAGDSVFAGTTVEEGELYVEVTDNPDESRIHSILQMITGAEALKSSEQRRMEQMADKLVPWNFALAGIVALATRSLQRTAATLMVDYSCALRMSGAIAVMAAQREGARRGFVVKGSRYFDAMCKADTIVFDKTGTLTNAEPHLDFIEPYDGYTREEVLKLAACLEEHFPHPVARAIVNAAAQEGIEHREEHAEVEYIVAHGIASSLHDKRVVIGSMHFVLEDEHVQISDKELAEIESRAAGTSPLLLAVDSELRGVLYIDDPLRPETPDAIAQLRENGFSKIIMLTGDSTRAAKRMAKEAGVDEFYAELLPEDKQRIVRELQRQGRNVCMVGDGVNDSPALAAANVSIALGAGSAVAREAADIALTSDSLKSIIDLRKLSQELNRRTKQGYGFTLAFNSALLAAGIAGLLSPQQSALLHNGSTFALSAMNSRRYN